MASGLAGMKLLLPLPLRFRLRGASPGVPADAVVPAPVADFPAGAVEGDAGDCGVISAGFGCEAGCEAGCGAAAGAAGAGAAVCANAAPLEARTAAAHAARRARLDFIGKLLESGNANGRPTARPRRRFPLCPRRLRAPDARGARRAAAAPPDQAAARPCSAAIRCSIGGCVENSAMIPALSVMPEAWIDCGRAPGSSPPSRRSALIIGVGAPR